MAERRKKKKKEPPFVVNYATGCNSPFVFEIEVDGEYYATLMTPREPSLSELVASAHSRYPGLQYEEDFSIFSINGQWRNKLI